MLRITDSLRLAGTKLRVRRIRLSITVVVSGLLFAALLAGLTMLMGAQRSVEEFDRGSLNNRYLVAQTAIRPNNIEFTSNLTARAEVERTQMIKDKQALAARLGLPYDPKSEPPIMQSFPDSPPYPNNQSVIVQRLIHQETAKLPRLTADAQWQFARTRGAVRQFSIQSIAANGLLNYMEQGLESFDDKRQQNSQPTPLEEFKQQFGNITAIDQSLLGGYLLSGASAKSNEIPLIIRYQDAEALLGLKPLDKNASNDMQLARLKELRQKAGQLTFSACYRNPASQELLQTAKQQIQAAANQAKKPSADYVKPDREYAMPSADSCAAPAVVKDNRSAEAKRTEANQRQFDQTFGSAQPEPAQAKFTFRVVGLMPDGIKATQSDIGSFLQQFLSTRLAYAWIMPRGPMTTAAQTALESTIQTANNDQGGANRDETLAIYEFSDPNKARSYLAAASCGEGNSGGTEITDLSAQPEPTEASKTQKSNKSICLPHYVVFASPTGSNSLVNYDAMERLKPIIMWTFIGVTIIAAFILLIIISRTIADSRKESAVFRALGATRLDISQIYFVYTMIVALLTALFSIAAGLIVVYIADNLLASQITATLRIAMTPKDLATTFHFWTIDWTIIGAVALSIIAAAVLACLIPLIRNTRRNPIKDMRDE
ncbi:ABC transporter permease [Candidatus Saccharibacteria bacterium oral taxon 488]|nr:ABC transporter permease [Candidatus Saccharibacteria bacterium oral taxon 488]QLF51804.1 ABC transporter permease [Candidatus Saccharibacteria bacterium oral taxon 488]